MESNISLGISIVQKTNSTKFTIGQNLSTLGDGASSMSIGEKKVTNDKTITTTLEVQQQHLL